MPTVRSTAYSPATNGAANSLDTSLRTLGQRRERFNALRLRLYPFPSQGLKNDPRASGGGYDSSASASGSSSSGSNGEGMPCLPCSSYRELVSAWRKAMKWTDGLDAALSVMLACSMSTRFVGEQLWVKILGPPACGKTTVLEGLAVNTKYIFSKDSIRGFHDGWKEEGGEDRSLAALAANKTLATKDGDTLLKAPNLAQILAEGRALYDRVSRTHYRNHVERTYLGHRMTWILCGTSALREIDDSELGARFIDCVVMDDIDDEFEDEVSWRVANREARNMLVESNGDPSSQYSPELALAMSLTGGYVGYLRENAVDLLSTIDAPEASLRKCARLGKFVAYMRARPPKGKDDESSREFAPRLVAQHVRLAQCLTVVLNRESLDSEVMARVQKVSYDTARGQTLEIVQMLSKRLDGLELKSLAHHSNKTEDKTRSLLRFLRKIGVVDLNNAPSKIGSRPNPTRFILTDRVKRLLREVEVVNA